MPKLDSVSYTHLNVTGLLDEAYTGLTATRIAEEYTRPCLLLRKRNEDETLYGCLLYTSDGTEKEGNCGKDT